MNNPNVEQNQRPLRQKYLHSPQAAMVTDQAKTCGTGTKDPFHFKVSPMPSIGIDVPVGVHQAVGGPHDAPTPGDIFCAALAACQDSTLRMIANILGVELETLNVTVNAGVDVRGTLAMDKSVPVGFQTIQCEIEMRTKPGTPEALIKKLQMAALQSCVIQQTLRQPPEVKTTFTTV